MMEGYLLRYDGARINLPPFMGCKLRRTGSVPCDSFEGSCPWDAGIEPELEKASRLIIEENGARRFTGILDECELTWDEKGGILSLSGRGLAALLLDNEAQGQDYQVATLADILKDHVTPYGVPVARAGSLPPVPGFTVETGSSEWQVLYSFARYYGGVQPRFDAWGSLTVDSTTGMRTVAVDDWIGVTAVTWRDKRYGVCSELLLQDRATRSIQRMVNEEFLKQGGCCRRVVTLPSKSAYQAARYSGQFQLDRSLEERFRVELTVPGSYFCEPGDRVSVSISRPALVGTWTVLETESTMDGNGTRVKLTLG
ncbi:MAG: hypothetical protein VB096_00545 [Pseudoflavonifractor sp.]|nr:hypothetical protein [Pseudoflavonifractor sp.]